MKSRCQVCTREEGLYSHGVLVWTKEESKGVVGRRKRSVQSKRSSRRQRAVAPLRPHRLVSRCERLLQCI